MVGFSRLTGSDEERTLARLRAIGSDLFDPTIALHHGRVVKRTGDGTIIEFRSVVDAVRCAIEVQNGMIERNARLLPEHRLRALPSPRQIECVKAFGDKLVGCSTRQVFPDIYRGKKPPRGLLFCQLILELLRTHRLALVVQKLALERRLPLNSIKLAGAAGNIIHAL